MFRSLILMTLAASGVSGADVSYRTAVVAVFARAGCNSGACHGNLNGKGGLKLSLRGEDAVFDHARLTRDFAGRRVNVAEPEQSLILLKATGRVPHEGGIRFTTDSREYAILTNWIAAGCPDDANVSKPVKLTVGDADRVLMAPQDRTTIKATAHFADASTKDVTHLASFDLSALGVAEMKPSGDLVKENDGDVVVAVRYLNLQSPVRVAFIPARPEPEMRSLADSKHPIDQLVAAQLKVQRLEPSPLCSDEVFIRRLFLDTCGVPPTAEAVRAFLADTSNNKRGKLIDAVLARPEFNDYWAMKWGDLLRNEEKSLDRKGVQVYHRWIRDWFAADRPLTDFAKEILTARGSTYENPPANFYRALRNPEARAESVAQVFLGTRIGCARCHNHPFDRWTQDDYHRFAAFFPRIDYRLLNTTRSDDLDKHEFIGNQVVFLSRRGEVTLPRTNAPAGPKTLGDDREVPGDSDRLAELANWVTNPANPFFARTQANRIWHHLVGRGIVEPNDDFRSANPPSNPALLDHLANEFTRGGSKLRPFARHVLTSRVYQLSSSPNAINAHDEAHFSKAFVQPLQAEQLLDAMSRTLGVSPKFSGYPRGTGAVAMPAMSQSGRRRDTTMSDRFLRVFGKPERITTCECERHDDAGILQAFQMINGEQVNQMLRDPNNALGKLLAATLKDEERMDELYLTALSRHPTTEEKTRLLKHVSTTRDTRNGWEDIAWSLVNSKEFLLRR